MTRFNIVKGISPDMPFANLRVGECFTTKYSATVWMKLSAAYYQQLDNPAIRLKQNDEREIMVKVLLEREDV